MLMKKLQNHAIEIKEEFVLKKGKMYPLLREERGEVCKFIKEQLKKGYIKLSKSPQTVLVFFVRKKDSKKQKVFTKLDLQWKESTAGDEHIKDYVQKTRKGLKEAQTSGTEHSGQHEVALIELGSALKRVSSKCAQVPAWCQHRDTLVSVSKILLLF